MVTTFPKDSRQMLPRRGAINCESGILVAGASPAGIPRQGTREILINSVTSHSPEFIIRFLELHSSPASHPSFHSSRRSTLKGAKSSLQAHEPLSECQILCKLHNLVYVPWYHVYPNSFSTAPAATCTSVSILTPTRRRPFRSSRTRCTTRCSSLLYPSHSSSPRRAHLTEVWRPGCYWTVSSVDKRHSTSHSGSLFRGPRSPVFSLLANPFLTYPAPPARYRQEKANIQHTPW